MACDPGWAGRPPGLAWTRTALAALLIVLFSIGCVPAASPGGRVTPSPAAFTGEATAVETPGPEPTATASRTPWPTATQTATPRPGDPPTATWTPVPGNPVWGIWQYRDLVFDLPVAWRKAEQDPPGGSAYIGPGGTGRPELVIRLSDGSPTPAESVAEARAAELAGAEIVESGKGQVAGGEGARYVLRLPKDQGEPSMLLGFYRVLDRRSVQMEFRTSQTTLSEGNDQFEEIALRARFRP